jgi:hypothetical protein
LGAGLFLESRSIFPNILIPGKEAAGAGAASGAGAAGAAGLGASGCTLTWLDLMNISCSGSACFFGSGRCSCSAGFFPGRFKSAASALACMEEAYSFDSILNCSGVIFEVGLFSISTPLAFRVSTTVETLMFKVVATCLSLIDLSSDMFKYAVMIYFLWLLVSYSLKRMGGLGDNTFLTLFPENRP